MYFARSGLQLADMCVNLSLLSLETGGGCGDSLSKGAF